MHPLKVSEHEIYTLLQGNPEAGHALISDRQVCRILADELLKNGTTEPREPTTLP